MILISIRWDGNYLRKSDFDRFIQNTCKKEGTETCPNIIKKNVKHKKRN